MVPRHGRRVQYLACSSGLSRVPMLRCTGNSAGISFGGKKGSANFFFSCRFPIEGIVLGWRAGAFVLVLTLYAFRKIVGTQRQKKIDAHWERTHETHRA